MLADANDSPVEANSVSTELDDISSEMSLLLQLLEQAGSTIESTALSGCELVSETVADQAPRDRYKLIGPAVTKVAAAGIATLPAVLAPIPAFAGTPHAPNLMLAMAARPVSTPNHNVPPALAATGPQLFPFSRPMQTVRSQAVMPMAEPTVSRAADKSAFVLNPRLRSIFSEQRKVAVTSKLQAERTFYRVQQGDSLYSISRELLGSGARWREIYAANEDLVGTGYLLRPGQRLVIKTSPVKEAPSLASKGYMVSIGDNLYSIAAKKLGDANRWREIVALNKAALKGRTTIYPNQWLMLPVQPA
ncbi:MAG: LysM peptidoglycan-binding domain-containing protein [Candidatus Sericytochromatia bacterium]|nr:LysM peptidoglycan-binding domain-containing protein [Candidatus Sericytochromatia bacterium]